MCAGRDGPVPPKNRLKPVFHRPNARLGAGVCTPIWLEFRQIQISALKCGFADLTADPRVNAPAKCADLADVSHLVTKLTGVFGFSVRGKNTCPRRSFSGTNVRHRRKTHWRLACHRCGVVPKAERCGQRACSLFFLSVGYSSLRGLYPKRETFRV